ncbi:MAG TPA: hypothetical protein VGI29_06910 [Candidatus Binataceae bacterium]
MAPNFPEPQWFFALGRLMAARGELFRRIGYVETRFIVRVLPDDDGGGEEQDTGVAMQGYALTDAVALAPGAAASYDADFTICARRAVWRRILDEIARNGRPELRHTLNSLALIGDELWLESADQLREDKFYRFNQSLQELFNLAAEVPAG